MGRKCVSPYPLPAPVVPRVAASGSADLAAVPEQILEDGERIILRVIRERPEDILSRVLLAQNLVEQGRGRELGVPAIAVDVARLQGLDRRCREEEAVATLMTQLLSLALDVLESPHYREQLPGEPARFLGVVRSAGPAVSALTDKLVGSSGKNR